jgi:hypothetical protein
VVLRYLPDVPVAVVPGSERNIKITYPGDLSIAEVLLSSGEPSTREPSASQPSASQPSAGQPSAGQPSASQPSAGDLSAGGR